jgi:hypothetical protein
MFYDVLASMKPVPLRSRLSHLSIGASNSPEIVTAIFRWEFLRRNLDYRADYNGFIGSFGDWLKDKGDWGNSETRANWTKSDQKYFHTEIEPVLNKLCQKWAVFDLFPPELGQEEWTQGHESGQDGRDFPPTWVSTDGNWDSRSIRELKRMGFEGTGTSTRKYQNLLLMQVDLNSPMKDLLNHVGGILRLAKDSYRQEMDKLGVKPPQRRRRFEHYDLYLKVWDLKQEGKRRAEIARLVFPHCSLESGLNRVRDHLKAANKLISGQFKEIR